MSDEAIQKDVSEEKEVKVLSRTEKLEQIAAANRPQPTPEPEEEVEEKVEEEVEEEELEEEVEEPEVAEPEDDLVILKVDGREEKVSKDKVLEAGKRAMQKESTADRRLEEAAKQRQELEKMQQELEEKLKAQEEKKNIGREVVESLFDDEEKAAEFLNQLAQKVDHTEKKLAAIDKEREEKAQKEQEEVVKYYWKSYEDIASDDDMHSALVRRVNLYQEEDPGLSAQEVIDRAAEDVYKRFGVADLPNKQNVQEVKDSMPKQPKKASARTPQKPEVKPKTTLDVLSEMKVARGRPAIR